MEFDRQADSEGIRSHNDEPKMNPLLTEGSGVVAGLELCEELRLLRLLRLLPLKVPLLPLWVMPRNSMLLPSFLSWIHGGVPERVRRGRVRV